MIFQLLATAVLIVIAAYAIKQKGTIVVRLLTVLSLAGFYFIWFPDHTTVIANFVGIGRGVDLIFYCWGAITLVILINVHLRFCKVNDAVTILARHIALSEAKNPE